MSGAMPVRFYGNPELTLSREEAMEVYRKQGCAACMHWDMTRPGDPCSKQLRPGRRWCKGFEEV